MRRFAVMATLLCVGIQSACRSTPQPAGAPPAAPPVAATPTPGLPRAEPMVRIGIAVDTVEVTVGSESAYEISSTSGEVRATAAAGEAWIFRADGSGRVTAQGPGGRTLHAAEGMLRIQPRDGGTVLIAGQPYRGMALIRPTTNGRLSAINVLELETYLLGVVPREIGVRPANEMDAMKAQAIAARTYAVGNLAARERQGFDFYATVADQVYGGVRAEDTLVNRAVRETAGEILTYNGRPIIAYYHSTCGGSTGDIAEIWPWRTPQPYLRAASDRIPGSDRYYCDLSNRFRWTASWTGDQLLQVLAKTLADHKGAPRGIRRIDGVERVSPSATGRVDLKVVADGREYVLRRDSVRWVFRPDGQRILNSSFISEVKQELGENGVERLEIHGAGWGHGVGMCQFGAMGRARAGQSYREILSAYYQGTELTRLY